MVYIFYVCQPHAAVIRLALYLLKTASWFKIFIVSIQLYVCQAFTYLKQPLGLQLYGFICHARILWHGPYLLT